MAMTNAMLTEYNFVTLFDDFDISHIKYHLLGNTETVLDQPISEEGKSNLVFPFKPQP